MKWIIEQRWNHVLFLHWKVDPLLLQPHLPFPLDLFEGSAILSIVPFEMDRIRFPFTPSVPYVSRLFELNLRTHIRVNGVPGIYFFTLDTGSVFGNWIANTFFHLPYRTAKVNMSVEENTYGFQSTRGVVDFSVNAKLTGKTKVKSELDLWATERYSVFTQAKDKIYEGVVMHDVWDLEAVGELNLRDRFSTQLPIPLKQEPDEKSYTRSLRVRFKPFRTLPSNR